MNCKNLLRESGDLCVYLAGEGADSFSFFCLQDFLGSPSSSCGFFLQFEVVPDSRLAAWSWAWPVFTAGCVEEEEEGQTLCLGWAELMLTPWDDCDTASLLPGTSETFIISWQDWELPDKPIIESAENIISNGKVSVLPLCTDRIGTPLRKDVKIPNFGLTSGWDYRRVWCGWSW